MRIRHPHSHLSYRDQYPPAQWDSNKELARNMQGRYDKYGIFSYRVADWVAFAINAPEETTIMWSLSARLAGLGNGGGVSMEGIPAV